MRLADYVEHMRQAAADACSFVSGLDKPAFMADRRTQQAVILNLMIIGEAATKIMDRYPDFAQEHLEFPGATCVACAIALPIATSTSISNLCGIRSAPRFRDC